MHTSTGELFNDIKIDIFPNPGSGQFVVSTNGEGSMDIYDALGKQVKQINLQNSRSEYTVDLTGLPKGIYMVNVSSGNKVISKKLFLE